MVATKLLRVCYRLGLIVISSFAGNAVAQSPQSSSPTVQASSVTPESLGGLTELLKHLTFLASFDHGLDADFSRGDKRIHTAHDLDRQKTSAGNEIESVSVAMGKGRYGNAIDFSKKTSQAVFYSGQSLGYRPVDWSGTLSVWMKLDPNQDLKPGYCDPVLFTDKQWDQAALFVDFDKELPRDFRLGVFPDYKIWNPRARPWEEIPIQERPMVVSKRPPFAADKWTHVCFTWQNANLPDDGPGSATLYLNGESQGSLSQVMRFTWQPEKTALMLGIYYIGLMDELAVFDTAISESLVKQLFELPEGLAKSLGEVK